MGHASVPFLERRYIMYKFFGPPLKVINSKATNKPIFRFDTKGEFITDDEEIIKRALGYFDYIKMTAQVEGKKVTKTVKETPLTITTKPKEQTKELSDDEIRQLAKDKHIKSWHVKAIDTLKEELGV